VLKPRDAGAQNTGTRWSGRALAPADGRNPGRRAPRRREAERLRAEIRRTEEESGRELQHRYQALHERYTAAEVDGDVDFLISRCPGKHGKRGRICVLDDGHDRERDPLHCGPAPH
jgi:hypothetical protein